MCLRFLLQAPCKIFFTNNLLNHFILMVCERLQLFIYRFFAFEHQKPAYCLTNNFWIKVFKFFKKDFFVLGFRIRPIAETDSLRTFVSGSVFAIFVKKTRKASFFSFPRFFTARKRILLLSLSSNSNS